MRASALLALSLCLTACQALQTLPQSLPTAPEPTLNVSAVAPLGGPVRQSVVPPRPVTRVKLAPVGAIQVSGQRVTLQLKLPALQELRGQNTAAFRTQALDLTEAAEISATVTDSHGLSYTPAGAVLGRVPYPSDGVISLSFDGVIPDPLLFVELQVRDASAEIPQADLAGVIAHTGVADTTATLNFQTTPVAKTLKALLQVDADRARAISLPALESLVSTITGVTGTTPNFTYTTHPALVNTALLATDLQTQLPGALTAANYRLAGASVSLDISGLIGAAKVDVQITDAASAVRTNLGNGTDQLITGIAPGANLKLLVSFVDSGLAHTLSVTPPGPLTLANGTTTDVAIAATAVTLESAAPSFAAVGDTITLNGSNFNTTPANNTVRFGSVVAEVLSAPSASLLTVRVPEGVWGTQQVSVEANGLLSNALAFEIAPSITSLAPASALSGASIAVTGSGFGPAQANNIASFGGEEADVTAAGLTALTVTLPPGTAGSAPFALQVGNRSATASFTRLPGLTALTTAEAQGGKAVLVRSLPLTLTGSSFDTVLANNQVRFTLPNSTVVTATPSAATATSLTVTVPAGVNLPGDVAVVVRTNGADSAPLTAVVPTVTLDVNNAGFF
ncbi:MAG: IPT/TIG domain-containing protein [Candidatus Sericytochromatia bacterium]